MGKGQVEQEEEQAPLAQRRRGLGRERVEVLDRLPPPVHVQLEVVARQPVDRRAAARHVHRDVDHFDRHRLAVLLCGQGKREEDSDEHKGTDSHAGHLSVECEKAGR